MLAGLCLLLVLVGIGLWYTSISDQTTTLSRRRNRSQSEQQVWMSQRSLDTARQFAKWSNNTRDEDRLAREAVQLADDELDLAYTTALREAQLSPAPVSQQTKQLRGYIRQLTDAIKAGNDRVIKLSSAINSAKSAEVDALQQQLDLAEAQITLNSQELEDARQDLLRTSDDVESRIQRLITAHKASFHNTTETQAPPTRLPTFSVPESMAEQVALLSSLRGKRKQLAFAQQAAVSAANNIGKQHDQLEKTLAPAASQNQSGTPVTHQDQIAALERLSQERKLLSDYDQRQQDQQQLAQVYGNWVGLLEARQLAVLHGILKSVMLIILVVILIVLAEAAMERYLVRLKTERRRLLTIRMVSRFSVRVICFLLVLLVIFGPPSQISTIIGLVTAGLTVALKDFIIAFLGWFVLMGRNGIRVGDWVEINGISGEVVEVGLLRTVLLETGNWADSGHPTGRRVTFVNSFAIERHYFNFSTAGQWLWDTLEILVPGGRDPHSIIEEIRKIVTDSTAESVRLAEQEWQRVTHKYGVQTFSATPSIDVRPTGAGVIINVRYITRAQERYEVRSKLYESVVELLHGQKHTVAASN